MPARRSEYAPRLGQVAEGRREKNVNGYLHRGIARHPFERRFSLTDHMKVTGAHLDNGMLPVELVHEVPEAAKPRTIEIGTGLPSLAQRKNGR
jgi:molecular chaperone IbpA